MNGPSYAAGRVLDELGIISHKDLDDIDLIAYARNAIVREKCLSGAEARLTFVGGKAIITISSNIDNPHRKRFSVAHELGHLELHRYKRHLVYCTSQNLNDWGVQSINNLEQEANEFAAALLMPVQFFASLCTQDSPSLNHISELAKNFNVSLTAAAIRYLYFCGEPCAVIWSEQGHVRWFKSNKEFDSLKLFIDVRSSLACNTLAYEVYKKSQTSRLSRRVKAKGWFSNSNIRKNATILEQSWLMPRYDAVLTLLWVDDELDDDCWF